MKAKQPPSELEVRDWLQDGRVRFPPAHLQLTRIQPQYVKGKSWDFELEVTWGSKSGTFATEYKSLFSPKAFEAALNQCRQSSLPSTHLPLILMPYLRPDHLEQLENQQISGIDLCGNGVLIVPDKIRIFRTGNPNRFATYAPIKNIYRKNTSMVARAFLSAAHFSNVLETLAAVNARNLLAIATGRRFMTLGTISKALKQLEEDLIIKRSTDISLLQPDKLLDQLTKNYEAPKPVERTKFKVQGDFRQLPKVIGEAIRKQGVLVMATGLASVSRYATMEREEVLTLYCPSLQQFRDTLPATETDRFANLEVIETNEEPPYFDGRQDALLLNSSFYWASPTQTYLELMAGDKRDREAAEQVRAHILRSLVSD